jgi:hypothetical protein
MASKRRQRRNSCEGKIRHKTIVGAWIASRKTDGKVRPYRCKFCSAYHVGHASGKQKRRRTLGE